MLAVTVLCLLLVGTSLQWAFNPSDFSPNSYDYQERRPSRPVEESAPVVGYIANPFVSPLTRKWRKLRSRRDFEQ